MRAFTVVAIWSCVVVVAQADGDAPVVPKPRKRLGSAPTREIDRGETKNVVGSVQTIEKQFLNTFQSLVATYYNQLVAGLPDDPAVYARYDIRMKLDTETNEPIDIAISGNLTERRRLLLLKAIGQACKAVVCPAEVRKKYGKVLDFSFDISVGYQYRKR